MLRYSLGGRKQIPLSHTKRLSSEPYYNSTSLGMVRLCLCNVKPDVPIKWVVVNYWKTRPSRASAPKRWMRKAETWSEEREKVELICLTDTWMQVNMTNSRNILENNEICNLLKDCCVFWLCKYISTVYDVFRGLWESLSGVGMLARGGFISSAVSGHVICVIFLSSSGAIILGECLNWSAIGSDSVCEFVADMVGVCGPAL